MPHATPARRNPSLWLAATGAAALGASFPLLFPASDVSPGFLIIDVMLFAASVALTVVVLLRSAVPPQTRRTAVILAAVGYALGLVVLLASHSIGLPRVVGAILVVGAVALVVASLLRGIGLPTGSLTWLLLLLVAAAFILFLADGSTGLLAAQLVTGVLAGLAVALPGLLAGRAPAGPTPRAAGVSVASSSNVTTSATPSYPPASSPVLGYVVTGTGIALVVAGIVWASVVGFYASDVPALIGLLAAGAIIAWIGQRLLKRSKRSALPRHTAN